MGCELESSGRFQPDDPWPYPFLLLLEAHGASGELIWGVVFSKVDAHQGHIAAFFEGDCFSFHEFVSQSDPPSVRGGISPSVFAA